MPNYAVGSNIPGYMPESDVPIFEDFESAKQYLIDELKRSEDSAGIDRETIRDLVTNELIHELEI